MGNPHVTLVWQSVTRLENKPTVTMEGTSRKSDLGSGNVQACVSQAHWWGGQWKSKILPKKNSSECLESSVLTVSSWELSLSSWLGRSRAWGGSKSEASARTGKRGEALVACWVSL